MKIPVTYHTYNLLCIYHKGHLVFIDLDDLGINREAHLD